MKYLIKKKVGRFGPQLDDKFFWHLERQNREQIFKPLRWQLYDHLLGQLCRRFVDRIYNKIFLFLLNSKNEI